MRKRHRTNGALLRLGLCCGVLFGGGRLHSWATPLALGMPSTVGRLQGNAITDATALFDAVKSDDVETAKRLLAAGISINLKDDQGFTPLMVQLRLAQYSAVPTPMLTLLLQYRPNFRVVSHAGTTVWDLLYWGPYPGTTDVDKSQVVSAMIKAGLDIRKDDGKLLAKAAFHGDIPMIKLLIDQGIDLHRDGGKALKAAAFWGENIRANPPVDTMHFLIDHGAYQPDDTDSRAAFRTIAFFGEWGLTQKMLALGAARHKDDLSDALIGASGGAGGLDINWGNVKVVNLLLHNGADPNGPLRERGGPLSYAVLLGSEGHEIVHILLQHGANVNLPDAQGVTPLMIAAGDDPAMVRLLLQHGANPNAKAKDGRTPLSSALASHQASTIVIQRILRRAGAKK